MRRFSGGYHVQFSYTLSKTMDNNDAQLGMDSQTSSVFPPNPYDPDSEWAPAIFDVRHAFAANATWELPLRNNAVLGGWQLNAIVSLRRQGLVLRKCRTAHMSWHQQSANSKRE
jgi:hypothetical protein